MIRRAWFEAFVYAFCVATATVCMSIILVFHGSYDSAAARHVQPRSVAVIGASGYIGSRLLDHLRNSSLAVVAGYDRDPRVPGRDHLVKRMSSSEIPDAELRRFAAVVFLGGLTGRKDCDEASDERVREENVREVERLAKRMHNGQTLVFASTSALAEGYAGVEMREDEPVRGGMLDRYSASMYERELALRALSDAPGMPRMVGLRFGTTVGYSPCQRTEMVHMALTRSAFLTGRLNITHPESHRAFLWLDDLVRAVEAVVVARGARPEASPEASPFEIYHLQSFKGTIQSVATAVAQHTGAFIDGNDPRNVMDIAGFSLNATKFSAAYPGFAYRGTQSVVVEELWKHAEHVAVGRDHYWHNHRDHGSKCAVCGSTDTQTVLDLHKQPLANDFRRTADDAMTCEAHPLRLVRCRKCHHVQLADVYDRSKLFTKYAYRSGTSRTLSDYFGWLARKVTTECDVDAPVVLEIASNDGTQLDKFKKLGWKTHGVDPAENLADMARSKGHDIRVGFWGAQDFTGLPETFDAIVAQNVFAHVGNPVEFLRACARYMSPRTKLYIQTSQCEMFETGQFDTVYHEHVSFFTAHSFQRAAELSDLVVVGYEITPIHGNSCLVTFMRRGEAHARGIDVFLERERRAGIDKDWFYALYQARATQMARWLDGQIVQLQRDGYAVAGYGAAAKGMVLLHFMKEAKNVLEFVVDDAPLKQGTFCPGTRIPVKPTTYLSQRACGRLAIVVFAWNFWTEIRQNILREVGNVSTVLAVLPFPQQRVIRLSDNRELARNHFAPLALSPRPPVRLVMIMHFRNEELLLPYFIQHHAPMFDHVVLIDYNSTDASAIIVREQAPPAWELVQSRNRDFAAEAVDAEVRDYERKFPGAWKIALTVTEFVVHPNLRDFVASADDMGVKALRFPSVQICGDDESVFRRPHVNLLKQRHQHLHKQSLWGWYARFIHSYDDHPPWSPGRHEFKLPFKQVDVESGGHIPFIAKFKWSPWPDIRERKFLVQSNIPASDIGRGLGTHHVVDTRKHLDEMRAAAIVESGVADLADADNGFSNTWAATVGGQVTFT
jgi:nucleoside-diphosphate-sugar epimerase